MGVAFSGFIYFCGVVFDFNFGFDLAHGSGAYLPMLLRWPSSAIFVRRYSSLIFAFRPSSVDFCLSFVLRFSFLARVSSLARSGRGMLGIQHNSAIRCHAPAVEQF